MYPIRQNSYYPNKNFVKKKEDDESSQSASAENQTEEAQVSNDNNQFSSDQLATNPNSYSAGQKALDDSKKAQAIAKNALDANIKNSTVNIAQILKDFKNTAVAIGSPDDLTTEVNTYLSLVDSQAQKTEPNEKLIKSNLKNAATLLDDYITETLQRPSKVVENWIDALLLQKINYKYDDEQINTQFLVKFPDKIKLKDTDDTEDTDDTAVKDEQISSTTSGVNIPKDEELKTLFLQAKKYSYTDDSKKAMETFQSALTRASEVDDKETQSKVFYEIGKIYDKNDYLSQALTSYNQSLTTTSDTNIKTKAHFSMAQIYDDVSQFETAINHYMSSISYAGENENLTAQSNSLTKIGNICTDKYDRQAFDFYSEATTIADETDSSKTKGYVASNLGNAYDKFNEPQNALKAYSNAVQNYQDTNSPEKVATNYQKAADVMIGYNNPDKAKSLLQKALKSAQQTDDIQLMSDIYTKLNSL